MADHRHPGRVVLLEHMWMSSLPWPPKGGSDPGGPEHGEADVWGARPGQTPKTPAPLWANAGSCRNHVRLLPELVQALLPLHSWMEATPDEGLEFSPSEQ
ncbi:uncharacterized protein ACIB01_007698 isoform 4-T4 [Guaruba guarouba]